jgi:hypothetical protein
MSPPNPESREEKVNFFVSYTSSDEDFAKWVAWELGRADFTYRIQAEHFGPGSRFIQEMREALQNSEQVIAIISPKYFESPYASLELNSAIAADPLGKARKVIPVRIEKFQMPEIFRDLVYIDLVGKEEREARRALMAGVRAARLSALGMYQQIKKRVYFPERKETTLTTPQAQVSSGSSKGKPVRIQYFACDTGRGLDFKEQYKLISAALRKSRHSRKFKLKAEFDVTDVNIFDKLNAYQPNVVHISGNQNGGDVLLPTEDGGEVVVSDEALAGFLSSLGEDMKLAVIDTCKSLNCAERISEVVDCALGVGADIFEEEATPFYQVFYQALGAGRSIAHAHGQAVAKLRFMHVPLKRIPKLVVKTGLDASRLFLVDG